jgi:hypothetical protein
LFGRLTSGFEKLQVTRELRPGTLQHAHNLLHLSLAVLFEQAGCARTPARALALKIHDIPRGSPACAPVLGAVLLSFVASGSELVHRQKWGNRVPLIVLYQWRAPPA